MIYPNNDDEAWHIDSVAVQHKVNLQHSSLAEMIRSIFGVLPIPIPLHLNPALTDSRSCDDAVYNDDDDDDHQVSSGGGVVPVGRCGGLVSQK